MIKLNVKSLEAATSLGLLFRFFKKDKSGMLTVNMKKLVHKKGNKQKML